MIYYGIVDKVKEEHKGGIYGRRKLSENEISNISKKIEKSINSNIYAKVFSSIAFGSLGGLLIKGALALLKDDSSNSISLQQASKSETDDKRIIIPLESLNSDFDITNNKELFYGLFNNFFNPNEAFQKIMESDGGSVLIITDRDVIRNAFKHYGGEKGIFSKGVYTQHPKAPDILIPLETSNELIKSFILEETIRAFEALGAKTIIIQDVTEVGSEIGASGKGVTADLKANFQHAILRKKEFAPGTFDIERAEKQMQFLPDYPNIMTVIQSRKYGNQILEEFTETVNLNVNLDTNVLSLYKANVGFNYNRKWYFKVEFFSK